MTDNDLITTAWATRENAYAPYSNFKVGAALLSTDGQTFTGCNVENISYGLTNCAERVAIANAISSGISSFCTIAIVADTDTPISPCGACRQVLAEFNITRILTSNKSQTLIFTLNELLPRATTGILNRP